MEYAPIGLLIPPPLPPFPASPQGVDLSPFEFALGLIAVITIPALIYAFIFATKCPSSVPAFRRSPRRSFSGDSGPAVLAEPSVPSAEVKQLRKEAEGECPVCLSAFGEGEEVKQLSVCNHYFHAPCIDAWLSSHPNCPVCRASIPVKRLPISRVPAGRGSDQLQGLPDASSLV